MTKTRRHHYFIVSLPRSRTAWLSTLLTWGRSFCYHEALFRMSPHELKETFDAMPNSILHAGDSDPGLYQHGEAILELFPTAKFVFIFRPLTECVQAEYRAMKEDPSPEYAKVKLEDVENGMREADEEMRALLAALPVERVRQYWYDHLDLEKTIRDIWTFLLPGMAFPERRYMEIDNFRVTQIFSKVMRKYPRVNLHEGVLERQTANAG